MLDRAKSYLVERRNLLLPWCILLVASINVIFIGGKRRTFAVFISALHDNFNSTGRMELNLIGDSYTAVAFFLMPLTTNALIHLDRPYRMAMLIAALLILVSCFTTSMVPDPTYMFFTHTLFHGIGSTIVLSTTALIVGEYFDKDSAFHVLATTLVSGGPYGALIFGPIYGGLVETYGWRTSFRVVGILFFLEVMLAVAAFIPKYQDYETLSNNPDATNEITDDDLQRPKELNSLKKRPLFTVIPLSHLKSNVQIVLWIVERILHNIVLYSFMLNMVDFMTDAAKKSISNAATINLVFGLGESVTFTAGVLLGDRLRGRLTLCYAVATFLAAVLIFTLSLCLTVTTAVISLAFFIGASVGVGNTCTYAASEEVMLLHGSIGFPSTKMVGAIGLFLAPFFSGYMIDTFGFQEFFIVQGFLTVARFLLLLAIVLILRRGHSEGLENALEPSGDASDWSHDSVTHQPCRHDSDCPPPTMRSDTVY